MSNPFEASKPARPWRAVVADSTPGLRRALVSMIKVYDPSIEIIETDSGTKLQEILMGQGVDIAFVNIQLQDISGPEALASARVRNVNPFTILISNIVIPKWVDLTLEVGAYEFLKKPFAPEDVNNILNAYRRITTPSRLLLVDNSPYARQLIQRVLSSARFALDIEETDDGKDALKLMRLVPYDVALIDFTLKAMDGLETACQARDIAPETKLILMAGSASATLSDAARHFGIGAIIKKPFYIRDVDYALHTVFGLRRPYLLNALIEAAAPEKQSNAV